MPLYLRDKQLNDLSITLTKVQALVSLCFAQADALRRANPNLPTIRVSIGIRFDQKGYTVFTYDDLEKEYRHATEVERLTFNIESIDQNGLQVDTYLVLVLDKFDTAKFLTVGFGDENWVNSAFSAFDESLRVEAAWYRVVKSAWSELLIQIAGVGVVFLISVSVARTLAPSLQVENSFLIAFLFVFLLGSNIWGFLQKQVQPVIRRHFPNVKFIREGSENTHWMIQGLILMIVGAVIGVVIDGVGNLFFGELATMIKEN